MNKTPTKDPIPATQNPAISGFFDRLKKTAKSKGKETKAGPEGLLGEPGELALYEFIVASGSDPSGLTHAVSVDATLQSVFLDSLETIEPDELSECMTLCLYGLIFGRYDREDFRYTYRYSLWKLRNGAVIDSWLKKAVVTLAALATTTPRELLNAVRDWIDYLGAPLWNPTTLLGPAKQIGVDLEQTLSQEDFRLTDSLRRYPTYIEEAVEGKQYDELRAATREWLPEPLSSTLLSSYRKAVYRDAQKELKKEEGITSAMGSVSRYLEKRGFSTHSEALLPVRLQELPSPPPAEAIDPIIFELIPQKLRVGLMPSVAYSAKTKKIEILFLGGPEIGRSAILIKTDTGGIVMDFGLSVSNHCVPRWVPELDMIDTVLVSHAHLDHIGGLPVLYENFTGKWCSVGHTGAMSMMLLDDALKVGTPLAPRKHDRSDMISRFTQENIDKVSKNHVRLEYGQTSEVAGGIMVTPIEASHIPGSASYLVDIEGKKILYTGDINMDKSVLFPGASPPIDADIVIYDGTYWNREDFSRDRVAAQLEDVLKSSGPVIIPSFAVGRSQEVLMMLENMGVTKRRNVIVAGMAEQVTKLCGYSGSWTALKKNKETLDKEDVLVAGGGMMGGGLARQQFEEHRNNPEAAVVLCGYLAPRTPGWNLLHGFEKHQCRVEYARLSAHTSSSRLQEWVHSCTGKRIMVHTPTADPQPGVMIPRYMERVVLPT